MANPWEVRQRLYEVKCKVRNGEYPHLQELKAKQRALCWLKCEECGCYKEDVQVKTIYYPTHKGDLFVVADTQAQVCSACTSRDVRVYNANGTSPIFKRGGDRLRQEEKDAVR